MELYNIPIIVNVAILLIAIIISIMNLIRINIFKNKNKSITSKRITSCDPETEGGSNQSECNRYHVELINENNPFLLIFETGNKIIDIKEDLKKAIESENYEEAARLRDELKALYEDSKRND